jgi:hypothetical protein
MILYNVTINIDEDVHDEWLEWMKSVHIPEVMETGYFTESKMSRLMIDEEQGITYSIQYACKSMEDYNNYASKEAPGLQAKTLQKYNGKFVAFRTLMEQVFKI